MLQRRQIFLHTCLPFLRQSCVNLEWESTLKLWNHNIPYNDNHEKDYSFCGDSFPCFFLLPTNLSSAHATMRLNTLTSCVSRGNEIWLEAILVTYLFSTSTPTNYNPQKSSFSYLYESNRSSQEWRYNGSVRPSLCHTAFNTSQDASHSPKYDVVFCFTIDICDTQLWK